MLAIRNALPGGGARFVCKPGRAFPGKYGVDRANPLALVLQPCQRGRLVALAGLIVAFDEMKDGGKVREPYRQVATWLGEQ